MIIHDVRVGGGEIVVGATDLKRWRWEFEDGQSHAVNAETLVFASLVQREGRPIAETVGLHVARGGPLRERAIEAIPELLQACWQVHEGGWKELEARKHLVGRRLCAL